jgi:hypothetical protein
MSHPGVAVFARWAICAVIHVAYWNDGNITIAQELLGPPVPAPNGSQQLTPPVDSVLPAVTPLTQPLPPTVQLGEPIPEPIVEPLSQPPSNLHSDWGESGWSVFEFAPQEAYLVEDDRCADLAHVVRYRRLRSIGERPGTDGTWVGGWIEAGETLNADDTTRNSNYPVMFNFRNTTPLLNQAYLFVESSSTTSYGWEWGNRVDVLLGSDALFVRVPGLELDTDDDGRAYPRDSDVRLAVPEAYTELRWPSGWELRLGHFYAPSSYEGVAAPENFFYSHSYAFAAAPFTYSGALVTYAPHENERYFIGYTHGANSFISSPFRYGVLLGHQARSDDRNTTLAYAVHISQEKSFTSDTEPRVIANYQLVHHFGGCWTYVLEPHFGAQKYGKLQVANFSLGPARWHGVNQALFYRASKQVDVGTRLEWFQDHDHFQFGVPVNIFDGRDYFALTGGVNYRIRPNLLLRPEIRMDWTNIDGRAGTIFDFNALAEPNANFQLTAAADIIWTF